MGSLTDYAELELLDHIFETGAYTPAATVYIGLLTSDPGETGSVAGEVSGNNYARQAITFSAASGRSIVQNGQIDFPECTPAGWGTITHFGIFDADTGGNMLAYGALTVSIVTVAGNIPFIPDLGTEISINSGGASDYLADILLDFMFRNQAFAQPNIHVALCDADPTDAGTGSTISEPGGNYARVDFADWTAAAAGALSNNTDIDFPTPSVDWPTVTHSAILDAATLGNLLIYATANPNQAPKVGDPVKFPAGDYDVTLT